MAVQPARIVAADLRHVPAPRIRRIRSLDRRARDLARPDVAAAQGLTAPWDATPALRAGATPWSRVDRRFRSRLRPTAVLLATIIVGTMLGLVYLTQMIAADEARYAVDRLLVERDAMMRTLTSQEARIVGWGSEAQVTGWAQRAGLDRLDDVLRVRAP